MKTPHAIEIIGGGLAGLSLGIALRREGVPVTLHDAGDYPRHRVCGEFITGLAARTIDRLGLASVLRDALPHHEVAWFIGARPPQFYRLPAPALGISRHQLDAELAREFTTVGGELHVRSRVTDLAVRPGRVFALGRRRARSPWLGLKFHVQGIALERDLEMHLGEHCYVGLTRVGENVVNVCGLFRRRLVSARGPAVLLAHLRGSGLDVLATRLARAQIVPETFCAVAALAFDARVPVSDGLHLGDAAAMIPPFTGNGMAMAFQSTELALEPLLAYARGEATWEETCRATNARLRGRFRVRLASADALHPFFLQPRRQLWVAALGRARLLPFRPLYASLH